MGRSRLSSQSAGSLAPLPSLRDSLRIEDEARGARREAEKWDREAAARSERGAVDARYRARAARRRVVRARLRWLLASGAHDALVLRVEQWLADENIDPAALDRLADALEVKPT